MRGRLAIAAVCLSWSAPARAQTALVLSYIGRGGDDLAPYLKPVAEALPQLSPQWGISFRRELDAKFGPAPATLPSDKIEAMKVGTDKATQVLIDAPSGWDRKVVPPLEGYRQTIAVALGALSLDQGVRDLYFQVLRTLARAYQVRDGQEAPQAVARMQEIVETLPEYDENADFRSQALRDLYRRVKREADQARGAAVRLELEGGGPHQKVYVDGRLVSCSTVCAVQVRSGASFGLFVETASGESRVHRDTATAQRRVAIDVPFEVALTTERYAGFRFDDATAQARLEPAFVKKLGRELRLAHVLVLTQSADGKPGLRLKAYSIGTGDVAVSNVGMLGGLLTAQQVAELTRRALSLAPSSSAPAPAPPSRATATGSSSSSAPARSSSAPAAPAPTPGSPEAQRAAERQAWLASLEKLPPSEKLERLGRDEYVVGHYAEAKRYGAQAYRTAASDSQRQAAMRLLGACACFEEDVRTLREAWQVLNEPGRTFIEYVCQRNGIKMPP